MSDLIVGVIVAIIALVFLRFVVHAKQQKKKQQDQEKLKQQELAYKNQKKQDQKVASQQDSIQSTRYRKHKRHNGVEMENEFYDCFCGEYESCSVCEDVVEEFIEDVVHSALLDRGVDSMVVDSNEQVEYEAPPELVAVSDDIDLDSLIDHEESIEQVEYEESPEIVDSSDDIDLDSLIDHEESSSPVDSYVEEVEVEESYDDDGDDD
jgi:hypothetical protein